MEYTRTKKYSRRKIIGSILGLNRSYPVSDRLADSLGAFKLRKMKKHSLYRVKEYLEGQDWSPVDGRTLESARSTPYPKVQGLDFSGVVLSVSRPMHDLREQLIPVACFFPNRSVEQCEDILANKLAILNIQDGVQDGCREGNGSNGWNRKGMRRIVSTVAMVTSNTATI